jgi:MFS family permease
VQKLSLHPIIASLIGSLSLAIGLVSSPFFGRLYDRFGNAKILLLSSGILSGISILGISIGSFYIMIIFIVAAGFFLSAGFVIVYAKARYINEGNPQYQTLSVSFVNGLSLFGAFWTPLLFSIMVQRSGYNIAWFISGIIVISLILPVLRLKK